MIKLVKFIKYLGRSGKGNEPPTSIKAQDLDDNFSAVTVSDSSRGVYKCDYLVAGTELVFRNQDKVEAAWQDITIKDGQGYANKFSVLATPPVESISNELCWIGFTICVRPDHNPENAGQYLFGVSERSKVFGNTTGTSAITITGIINGINGWHTLEATSEIWLQWNINPEDPKIPTQVSVQYGSNLPTPSATVGFKKIGKIFYNELNYPGIDQLMYGSQRFIMQCVNGTPMALVTQY